MVFFYSPNCIYFLPRDSIGQCVFTTYTIYVIFYRQDIPVSENTDHYMFQNLEPNQNYSVSVTMRNGVGEGPPATIYISTTPEPTGTLQKVNMYI